MRLALTLQQPKPVIVRAMAHPDFDATITLNDRHLATAGLPGPEAAAAVNTKADGWHIRTAEADVDPAARFMVEYGLDPESWLRWPDDGVASPRRDKRITACSLEVNLTPRGITRLRLERPGDSPKVVASISVAADGAGVLREVAFVHCTQDQPPQRQVVVISAAPDGEGTLLARLTELVKTVDPDVLVNHGGRRADWRLLDAAWVRHDQAAFPGWARLVGAPTVAKPDTADAARVTLLCPGRIEFDTQAWMQRNQGIKCRSYDLEDVVANIRTLLDD